MELHRSKWIPWIVSGPIIEEYFWEHPECIMCA